MAHFARVQNGIVTQVIVAQQDVINTGHFGPVSEWIQTSYNTKGGVHYDPVTNKPDGGVALRGNFAGIGYIYDATHDVFYAPQPFPSWTISAPNWIWTAPVSMPSDAGTGIPPKVYAWNEATKSWDVIELASKPVQS